MAKPDPHGGTLHIHLCNHCRHAAKSKCAASVTLDMIARWENGVKWIGACRMYEREIRPHSYVNTHLV